VNASPRHLPGAEHPDYLFLRGLPAFADDLPAAPIARFWLMAPAAFLTAGCGLATGSLRRLVAGRCFDCLSVRWHRCAWQ